MKTVSIFAKNIYMPQDLSKFGFIPEIQQAVDDLNFTIATDIQKEIIPLVLNQQEDIVALAKTGTGKTAAFGLPLLQRTNQEENHIQTLVLAPTRELAQQIFSNLSSFASHLPEISMVLIAGGSSLKSQTDALKSPTHIVVATPGRLVDLLEKQALDLSKLSYLVLDEADEMFQALKDDLIPILNQLPKKRRTLMFSATMPGGLKDIVHNYMSKNVISIQSNMESIGHEDIEHEYMVVEPIEKLEILLYFLNTQHGKRGIIFCKTKAAVNKLAKNLAIRKISSGALHGSLTQGIRDRIMEQFRAGYIDILVATDLVARGIDVKGLSFIVNYHLPDTYDAYVHRSGRTGRAGEKGLSMTILQKEEENKIKDFETELGIKFKKVAKADAEEIEKNNAIVWARKLFKTKPNRKIPNEVREEVKTIFHHLTKEELMDKVLANYWAQNKKDAEQPAKDNNKIKRKLNDQFR